jgi:LAO/AO transport system kinase
MDYIFIETVGVGQSEVDIVKNCDTTLMVMVPGLGDDIQAIKAGIMEIGDVFAINKSDRDGAKKTAREIDAMLDGTTKAWRPPVKMVIATKNEGVSDLLESIHSHHDHMHAAKTFERRRQENAKNEIVDLIKYKVMLHLFDNAYNEQKLEDLSNAIVNKETDPYSASDHLLERFNKKKEDQ